jgi:3-hydroxyacyl-CoA dehydrogenase
VILSFLSEYDQSSKFTFFLKVAAVSGHKVTLVELDPNLLEKAKKSIGKSLERVGKKKFKDEESKITEFVKDSMERIDGSVDLQSVVKNTDIVIEAIVENLAAKQKLFASIDNVI